MDDDLNALYDFGLRLHKESGLDERDVLDSIQGLIRDDVSDADVGFHIQGLLDIALDRVRRDLGEGGLTPFELGLLNRDEYRKRRLNEEKKDGN